MIRVPTDNPQFQRLYRRHLQACEKEKASQYVEPVRALKDGVSYEKRIPFSDLMALRRAGFRLDD